MFLFMPRKSPFAHLRSPRVVYVSSDLERRLIPRGFLTREKRCSLLPPLLAVPRPWGCQGSCWGGLGGAGLQRGASRWGFTCLTRGKKPLYASQPSASVCTTPQRVTHAPHGLCTYPDGLCTHPDGLCTLPMSHACTPWVMDAP